VDKKYFTIISIIIFQLILPNLYAEQKKPVIYTGFLTGENYEKLDDGNKAIYLAGVIDGIWLSPLFSQHAQKKIDQVRSHLTNMSIVQITAIVTKYHQENPDKWHYGMHLIVYSALMESYNKNNRGGKK